MITRSCPTENCGEGEAFKMENCNGLYTITNMKSSRRKRAVGAIIGGISSTLGVVNGIIGFISSMTSLAKGHRDGTPDRVSEDMKIAKMHIENQKELNKNTVQSLSKIFEGLNDISETLKKIANYIRTEFEYE